MRQFEQLSWQQGLTQILELFLNLILKEKEESREAPRTWLIRAWQLSSGAYVKRNDFPFYLMPVQTNVAFYIVFFNVFFYSKVITIAT